MADLFTIGQTTSKGRVGNGGSVRVTGTRDGAIYTADYILATALEGRLFQTSVGTITTPISFGSYDALQPELVIDVPTGTSIIPVHLQIHLETSAGTLTEVIANTVTNVIGAGTSTALSILSTRTNRPVTSGCSGYGAYSGNGAASTGVLEFWRYGDAFADAATKPPRVFEWDIRKNTPQVLVGPAALVVYISATSTQATGYIKASWMEFASADL
jgi:hypothetical protein